MEQKTAQFLVLFNHFYPLASKNLNWFQSQGQNDDRE